MSYRWTSPKALRRHGHGGDEYVRQGETFEPTDAELRAFGDAIAETDGDSASESGGSGGENGAAGTSENSDLVELSGVGDTTADKLRDAGYGSFAALREADATTVADDVDGLSETDVEDLQRQLGG